MTFFTDTVNKHAQLIQTLSDFVLTACEKRDISHGWAHMKLVFELSIQIAEEFILTDKQMALVIICAWLHDVDDHKYGNENKDILDAFITENFAEEKTKILAIIERVSFSREKKYGHNDWLAILGIDGIIVRNIVSDADKIDAINAERCYQYKKTIGTSLSEKDIWTDVVKHYNDKLVHLKDKYILSYMGKQMAQPVHEKMISEIDQIKQKYNIQS